MMTLTVMAVKGELRFSHGELSINQHFLVDVRLLSVLCCTVLCCTVSVALHCVECQVKALLYDLGQQNTRGYTANCST